MKVLSTTVGDNRCPGCVIGLDVGGTKMACCVVTLDGVVHASGRRSTLAKRDGVAVAEDAWQLVNNMSTQALELGFTPTALGIAICELVDLSGQIVSEHTVAWRDPKYMARFAEFLPTVMEADCRAAALAEARFGAGREFPIFLYVTVGTGISCSLVIEGRPYMGARGATGTMATGDLTTLCLWCGELSASNLEKIASGTAVASRYRALLAENSEFDPAVDDCITSEQVIERARSGDVVAERVLNQGATCLGSAIAQLVNVLDPHAVIMGGGLGAAPGYYWETLVDATRRQIWSNTHRMLPIVQGKLGEFTTAIGAALHAAERLGE